MKKFVRRGILLVVALAVTASPLMTLSAEAARGGNGKYRGRGPQRNWTESDNRGGRYIDRGGQRGSDRRGQYNGSGDRGGQYTYRGSRSYGGYAGRYEDRHIERRSSGIGPFLGGLAVGTIIGSQYRSCPPPPRRIVHRVYVYHCDCCDTNYRSYDGWTDHLVMHHRVPACEVHDYYPEYDGGYWEEY